MAETGIEAAEMAMYDAVLTADEWRQRQADHAARVRPWIEERTTRAARGVKHPVYDFLFEYYSYRPSHLARWSPGVGVLLEGAKPGDIGWRQGFIERDGGLVLPVTALPPRRVEYVHWAIRFLEAVAAREPSFGCFGLHEWAMVYRTNDIRHGRVPLRLSADGIAGVVEGQGLRCTHYDAYRFFTPAAAPRNRTALTRPAAIDQDQPGCVHANMDLYKFAYTVAPFTSGELIAETFNLALDARRLDMRASPYDLSRYGFEPIPIETPKGREQYMIEQYDIADRAAVMRSRVLKEYEHIQFMRAGHSINTEAPAE